jgi:hypothetical protein
MKTLTLGEPFAASRRARVQEVLQENMLGPKELASNYGRYQSLVSMDAAQYLEGWAGEKHSLSKYEDEITRHIKVGSAVVATAYGRHKNISFTCRRTGYSVTLLSLCV